MFTFFLLHINTIFAPFTSFFHHICSILRLICAIFHHIWAIFHHTCHFIVPYLHSLHHITPFYTIFGLYFIILSPFLHHIYTLFLAPYLHPFLHHIRTILHLPSLFFSPHLNNNFLHQVPVVLCGTMTDLREDPDTLARLARTGRKVVTAEQVRERGGQISKELGTCTLKNRNFWTCNGAFMGVLFI